MTIEQQKQHFCLSKEEIENAWEDQHNGDTLVKVSLNITAAYLPFTEGIAYMVLALLCGSKVIESDI